ARARTDPSFVSVVEQRRSVRDYAAEPMSFEQLAEVLYRAARIQRVLPAGQRAPALRPAPARGALHAPEVYLCVAACPGLRRALCYAAQSRLALGRLPAMRADLERLLQQAWHAGDRRSPLKVSLGITARCRRVFWKYQGMAYALILKTLGAL